MQNALFNPKGRLARNPFLRGLIVVLAVTLLLDVAAAYVSPVFQFAVWLMVYPYLCLFGKRLHDAGYSAWLFLAFFAGFGLLHLTLTGILSPLMSAEYRELQQGLQEVLMDSGMGAMMQASQEIAPQLVKLQVIPKMLSLLITNAILGMIAATLKSDPDTNRHGPPTHDGAPAETFS